MVRRIFYAYIPYLSSVGLLRRLFSLRSFHNLQLDKRNRLHTFFLQTRLHGVTDGKNKLLLSCSINCLPICLNDDEARMTYRTSHGPHAEHAHRFVKPFSLFSFRTSRLDPMMFSSGNMHWAIPDPIFTFAVARIFILLKIRFMTAITTLTNTHLHSGFPPNGWAILLTTQCARTDILFTRGRSYTTICMNNFRPIAKSRLFGVLIWNM